MTDDAAPVSPGRTRRTVVRTVAWTAPAVAVAAATPAFATSTRNDISNRQYTLTREGSQVRVTGISVTNDGPTALAARSVVLYLTASGSDLLWLPATTGSWILDPASVDLGTQLSYLYDATIPVGESVPLDGSVSAVVYEGDTLVFSVAIAYRGPV